MPEEERRKGHRVCFSYRGHPPSYRQSLRTQVSGPYSLWRYTHFGDRNYPYFSIFLCAAVCMDSIWEKKIKNEDQVHGPADSVEIYYSKNSSAKHFSCSPRFVLLCSSFTASSFIPSSSSAPSSSSSFPHPILLFLSSTSSSQQLTVSDCLSSQAMRCSIFQFILVSLYTLYIYHHPLLLLFLLLLLPSMVQWRVLAGQRPHPPADQGQRHDPAHRAGGL